MEINAGKENGNMPLEVGIRRPRVGRKDHIIPGSCALKVAEEFFHETGRGVLLGGRLRGVSPEGTVLHLAIQLGGVTGLCNQTTVCAQRMTQRFSLVSHFSLELRGAITQPPSVTPRP